MLGYRRYLLLSSLFFSFGNWLAAQAEYHLRLQPDGETYTTYIRPQTDWLPPFDNVLQEAKLTVVVPANSLEVNDLESHLGEWEMTNAVRQPLENTGADYFLFELVGAVADSAFLEGVEMPIFSFKNSRPCTGAFELMDLTADPFAMPNSTNMPVGHSFVVEGAGGEAYVGNYNTGQADCTTYSDCHLKYELQAMPNGFYEISLKTDNGLPMPTAIESLKMTLKVPSNFFKIHDLTNLQIGEMTFNGIMRFDAPIEEPTYDYIVINMAGTGGQSVALTAGGTLPLLRFGNGGSCQGDSIFLVKNSVDPFFQPNSQNATIGQQVVFENADFPQAVCLSDQYAVPCKGCLFTAGVITVDEILDMGPITCLGQTTGSIQFFAGGADSMTYSIDGGQNWQSSPVFDGVPLGDYQPLVKGVYYGCPVAKAPLPLTLEEETKIDLHLGMPDETCEGSDLPLQITAPLNMPTTTSYSWSGPIGFAADIPDPVLFDVNAFQTGTYTLTVNVPGCDEATATTSLEVIPLPDVPTLQSNAPVCDGDPLILASDIQGAKYEWIGPAGQSGATLALDGLTTDNDSTILFHGHPAYLNGDWKIRLTDANGCVVESETKPIAIKNRPQAFAANNGPICQGKNAELSSVPLAGAIYRWRKQGETDVFSFDQSPTITNVLTENTYELEIEQDGCISENIAVTTVALHPKPSAYPVYDYEIAADCSPEDIQLTANASDMVQSFEWSGTNGFSSQVENPLITNANALSNGSYQLEVTNIYGCSVTLPFDITGVVDAIPTPDVQSTGAVCPGGDIVLSVAPYSGSGVSYKWYKSDNLIVGATSSQLNLDAVQPSDEANYSVEIEVDNCKTESADLLVEVLDKPTLNPDFILSFPCEGSTLQLLSNTSSANVTGWEWSGPNGFSSNAQTPVIYNTEFDNVGSYSLTITANNGCTATGSFIVDGILPVPDAPTVATNTPVCPEDKMILTVQNPTLIGSVSYEWFNGLGQYIDNGTSQLELTTADPLAVPPFLVKKRVNGCESDFSDPIPVDVKPMPVADAENSGGVCPGGDAQLMAAPVNNATYTWREVGNPQVVSFEQNPLLTLDNTTTFELTVQTVGCDTTAIDTTTVFTKTVPIVTNLTGGGSYCEGATVQLSGQNEAALSGEIQYTWTGPNGFYFTNVADASEAFTVDVGVLQAQNEGTYTLQLESEDGCLSMPQSVVVDFVEMPEPPVLMASSDHHCEGETLELTTTVYAGNDVTYYWFLNDGNADVPLDTTDAPNLFLDSITASQSGFYFVKTNIDGCEPSPSNQVQVTVFGVDANIEASNSTSDDEPVCEGGEVQLEATLIPNAIYDWSGPAGVQYSGNVVTVPDVAVDMAGNYAVEITIPGCANTLTTSTTVFVKSKPTPPVLTGPSEVCAGSDVAIEIGNADSSATYHFYFTENNTLVETGSVPMFSLPEILVAQSGSYYAVAEVKNCESDPSDWLNLEVVEQEVVAAFAGEEQVVCSSDEAVFLEGNRPASAAGIWRSLSGAMLSQPNEPTTSVHDLRPGANYFIWEISQPICQYVSTDTTMVFYEKITAAPDEVTLSLTDTIAEADVLFNDEIHAIGWDVNIHKMPKKGLASISADDWAVYRPYPDVFGEDQFDYEICSMTCPDVCSRTTVDVLLKNAGLDPSDCFVPNYISPNGDGENDVFVVPCAAVFEGSELVVFNRYGTPIYQNPNYQNDWGGTHDGQPLPVGTYFYQLSLNDENRTMLQGYVAVMR